MLCLLCIIQIFSSNFHLLLILLIEILTAKDFIFLGKKICYSFVYGFFLHFCVLKKIAFLGIPWCPAVRSWCFHCHGFKPWLGAKIPQAMQGSQKQNKTKPFFHQKIIQRPNSVVLLHLTPHSQCINIIYNVSFLHLTPHSQCIWILFIMYSYRVPSQWLIKWYSFWDCFWVTDVLWTLNEIGLWGNVVVH